MGNYSFKTTNLPEPVNSVIEGHNFTQGAPHTAIYAGQTGLTFRNCNLTNCLIPDGSIVEGSAYPKNVSRCSHVHPKLLQYGYISECAENCEHLVDTQQVTIDSVVVDTTRYYEDKAVA